MVAQTVLIKTYQCMCNSPTFEEAQLSAVQALNVNGLHLSLVAPLCHQLVQRLVKFAPLLVLSTVLPYMRVPVVSLRSVLELFNGLAISDPREALAVKSFLQRALDTGSFLPLTPTPNGRSDPSSNITPYLSSILPVDQGPSGSNISEMRQTLPQADKSSLSFEVVRLIASTLYKRNAKTLKQCAFVQEVRVTPPHPLRTRRLPPAAGARHAPLTPARPGQESTFAFMLNSVRDQEYDLRGLFGGMSSFANSRALVRAGTGRSADGMPTTFKTSSDSSTQSPDPMFIIERVSNNHHEYALGVRVWDALLFASLMRRPRRDYGIVYDFAQSVTEYVLRSLPCSVMPYSVIPSMRYDPFSGEQTHLRVEGGHRRPWLDVADDRPEQVLRFRDSRTVGPNAAFTYASPGPTGIVEDDAFMAPIIALQQTLKCEHFSDIPLDLWHLDIGWQWGAVYPFVVYPNTRARDPPLPWQRGLGTPGRRFAVVLNQRRFSMQLYAQCGDQAADVADFYGESVGFVDDWVQASMELVAEFTVVRPTGGDPPPHTSVLGTFHACQQALFASGVGPVPYLRRPGIAVRTPSGIGCVVPHRHARSGCRAAPTSRCYFCVNNPYVEASVSPGEPVHRCCAEALLRGDTLVRAGTALLLSLECPDFVAAFLPHQVGPRPAHKRAHCAGGQPQAADPEDPEDEHGFLLPDQGAEREDARVDPGEPTASQNGDRILCWLQVPSSITPRDGYLSVAVRCKVGIDPSQTHVLSVQPAFLSLPSGSEEAADARQMVYGLPRRQAHP